MKKAIPIIAVLLTLVSLPLHAQLPERKSRFSCHRGRLLWNL